VLDEGGKGRHAVLEEVLFATHALLIGLPQMPQMSFPDTAGEKRRHERRSCMYTRERQRREREKTKEREKQKREGEREGERGGERERERERERESYLSRPVEEMRESQEMGGRTKDVSHSDSPSQILRRQCDVGMPTFSASADVLLPAFAGNIKDRRTSRK
jgi:hypothetical protein